MVKEETGEENQVLRAQYPILVPMNILVLLAMTVTIQVMMTTVNIQDLLVILMTMMNTLDHRTHTLVLHMKVMTTVNILDPMTQVNQVMMNTVNKKKAIEVEEEEEEVEDVMERKVDKEEDLIMMMNVDHIHILIHLLEKSLEI
jgi:hypothetical protein